MPEFKLGLMVTGSEHFELRYAEAGRERARNYLKTLGCPIVEPDAIVCNPEQAWRAVEQFKREDIKLLIVQPGVFTWDNVGAVVATELAQVPLVMWAVHELPLDGGPLRINSLCSVMMNGTSMAKLGKNFLFVYGDAEDARVSGPLARMVRVTRAVDRLRHARMGLAGYRPIGFYGSTFDELALRKALGIELEHLDLSRIFDAFGQVTEAEIDQDRAKTKSGAYGLGSAVEEGLRNSSRLYLAIKRLVRENKLDGLALKCWPEMLDKDLLPCLTNSRLGDDGIPVACEGDVHGMATQLIHVNLAGGPTFFCDLVDLDEARNAVFLWHCGSCPTHLAKPRVTPKLNLVAGQRDDFKITCPIVEFPLKPGRVTFSRLCTLNGQYRLFIATGEALGLGQDMRGSCCWVKLDAGARQTVEYIVNEHVEHHFSLAYGDLREDLLLLCELTGIKPMLV